MKKKHNIPIWVLNLKRDEERLLFMQKQSKELNVEFRVIEAVDGKSLTEEDLNSYSKKMAEKCCKRELSVGEIGCALSHANIWELVIEERHEEVLVLEDDAKIGRSLLGILENRSKLPADYEFVNFSTDAPQEPFGEFIADIYRVSRHREFANGCCAYLITRKGAEKLLGKVFPIRWPADGLTGRTYITGLVSYGIYPRVAVLGDFESSIWENTSIPKLHFKTRKYDELRQALKATAIFLGLYGLFKRVNRYYRILSTYVRSTSLGRLLISSNDAVFLK